MGGTVYKRKGSPYWWIKYGEQPRDYHRESTKTTNKGIAQRMLAQRLRTHLWRASHLEGSERWVVERGSHRIFIEGATTRQVHLIVEGLNNRL